MKTKLLCLTLALTGLLLAGCETTSSSGNAAGYKPGGEGRDYITDGEVAEAQFGGGDGSSKEQAVVITGASGEKTGVRAEYVWLHNHYPGYRLKYQGLQGANGKAYDAMAIETAAGEPKTVYFDISQFFGKF